MNGVTHESMEYAVNLYTRKMKRNSLGRPNEIWEWFVEKTCGYQVDQ